MSTYEIAAFLAGNPYTAHVLRTELKAVQAELRALRDKRWHEYAAAVLGGLEAGEPHLDSVGRAKTAADRADAMMALLAQRAGDGQG